MQYIPLIVLKDNVCVDVHFVNEKAAEKSLEQGNIWTVHPDTEKIVPLEPVVNISSLHKKERWYEVHALNFDVPKKKIPNSQQMLDMDRDISSAPNADMNNEYTILETLFTLIKSRKETMPEGAYTTHLFSKGDLKIRKKVGEEAVEVILAQNKEELQEEIADLLYHLLVLCVSNDIHPLDSIKILDARYRSTRSPTLEDIF